MSKRKKSYASRRSERQSQRSKAKKLREASAKKRREASAKRRKKLVKGTKKVLKTVTYPAAQVLRTAGFMEKEKKKVTPKKPPQKKIVEKRKTQSQINKEAKADREKSKKKPIAKKAPVKKAPVKKAPVKKAPVKVAKKAPSKKAPAKKKRQLGKYRGIDFIQKRRRKKLGIKASEKVGRVRSKAKKAVKTKGGTYVKYEKKSKSAQSFRDAFKEGCSGDAKTFSWDGRVYACKRK